MNSEREIILEQIRVCLKGANAHKAFLFGSRAKADWDEDSDVDLIVVLNRAEPFQSFEERRAAILDLRKRLRTVSLKHGLDLLVFTQQDWERFVEKGSSFSREVLQEGMAIA